MIRKLLMMVVAVAAIATSNTAEAAKYSYVYKTLTVGDKCTMTCIHNGKYVKPKFKSGTSTPAGVLSYKIYSSLSGGAFGYVIAKKAGTARIKVYYGGIYYCYVFSVLGVPTIVSPSVKWLSSTKYPYKMYRSKDKYTKYYRLCWTAGSSYYYSNCSSWTTSPSWNVSGIKKGVKYFYWIDCKTASGTIYWNKNKYRWVKL